MINTFSFQGSCRPGSANFLPKATPRCHEIPFRSHQYFSSVLPSACPSSSKRITVEIDNLSSISDNRKKSNFSFCLSSYGRISTESLRPTPTEKKNVDFGQTNCIWAISLDTEIYGRGGQDLCTDISASEVGSLQSFDCCVGKRDVKISC